MRSSNTLGLAAMAATAALTLTACGGGDDGGSAAGGDDGGETVRIGIKYDQPGLGFKDGEQYTGFDVDVAKYVANELGYAEDQIEWVESPSANRENMLANDQVDMIFATYSITDERKETVDFAGPYFVAGQDLLVRTDESGIQGPEDLDGKNLCSVTGSTSAQKVKFRVVGNPFSEERYGVGLPKGTKQCPAVNEAVTKMIEEGAWEEALVRNTEGSGYEYDGEFEVPSNGNCA